MLVFPDLGSTIEVAVNDREAPICPWNKLMYPETGNPSTIFWEGAKQNAIEESRKATAVKSPESNSEPEIGKMRVRRLLL